ncbi:furin-like protease 2 isoform X1 [Ruditapes philippinarum]|uniref:furin-like protease 2 isoform X1 n=1 Tax=Ruditapes philippinarum TaxID=129788 RepID=UPI00295A5782|nr:furin-like protease 2 isoform X1 [Ruditapes philippinarum]
MECEPSYYFAGDNCHPCPDSCLSCTDQTNCTKCKIYKWETGVSQCIQDCSKECLNGECHDDTGYCLHCEHGKYGRKCQHNCSLCKNDKCDLYRCVEGCKSGYFEYQTSNDYFCQKCSTYCKQCDNGTVCRICNDGFYLNVYYYNGKTIVNCAKCLNENECSNYCLIPGCHQCIIFSNRPMCADCPEGETFNGVSCEQNGHHCTRCPTNCDSNETLVTINTTATSTTTTPCTQNQASEDKVIFTTIGFFSGIGFSLVIVAIVTLLYFIRRR